MRNKIMATPQEIHAEYNSYTYAQAYVLAKTLDELLRTPLNKKEFVKMYEDLRYKDKLNPHEIITHLLGYAYDWSAFGN